MKMLSNSDLIERLEEIRNKVIAIFSEEFNADAWRDLEHDGKELYMYKRNISQTLQIVEQLNRLVSALRQYGMGRHTDGADQLVKRAEAMAAQAIARLSKISNASKG